MPGRLNRRKPSASKKTIETISVTGSATRYDG